MRKAIRNAVLLILPILLVVICTACGNAKEDLPANETTTEESSYSITLEAPDNAAVYTAQLSFGDAVVIGREETCDIVITGDPYVSRTHCKLFVEDDSIYLEDMGSTNGTFIMSDGEKTNVSEKISLSTGDEFILGDYALILRSFEKQS